MLQSIRDRTHGWIAGTIISLVILSFALWGIHSYMTGATDTSIVAKVNGVNVTRTQLAGAYERMRRQMQVNMGPGNVPERVEADLRTRALDTLINLQVLKQGSLAEDYRVSQVQIDGFLENMPEFQVNGRFSLPRLQQFLATTMMGAGDFLELIKTNLLIEQPRLGIIFTSFALPDEVMSTIALVNQERDVDYLTLPQDNFLKQIATVSPADIEAFYKTHENEFKTPEQVSAEYLELTIKDVMATLHPTEAMLKNYYNDNINSYTQPMQWDLMTVMLPLSDKASETELQTAQDKAQEVRKQFAASKNLPTGFSEGKLKGWLTLSLIPTDLQKAVAGLSKAGEVSEPVRTQSGLVLIKAIAIKEAKVQSYEQVKDKVSASVLRQQAEEKYAELKEKLSNVTYEYPDSLQPAAKALGLTVKTTELFTQEKGANDISANKKIRDAAFSGDVLSSQNNSDVIQVNPDTTIVLRVKSHVPAALLSLNAVQKQIVDQLKVQLANQKALVVADEIKSKLQAGATSEQITQQYGVNWSKAGYLGRYSTKVDSAILYAAFRLPRPQKTNDSVYATTKIPNGYAVVMLKGVRDGSINANNGQYDVFADQVQNSEGLLEYKLYERSLMKKAKIVSFLNNTQDS